MTVPAGVIFALAKARKPKEALGIANRWLPAGWPVLAVPTGSGAAILAGPAVALEGQYAVVGAAVQNPWGLPGREVDPPEMFRRLSRYGHRAVHLASGPFALVDLERSYVASPLNGIIPIHKSDGGHATVGSDAALVCALADARVVGRVAAGSVVGTDALPFLIDGPPIYEGLRGDLLRGIDREVSLRVRELGEVQDVGASALPGVGGGFGLHRLGSSLIATPSLALLARGVFQTQIVALQDRVSRMWWEAGLRGATLFVPPLERPSSDTMALALA